MPRIENRQGLTSEMSALRTPTIEREQKAQIRAVGLQQRQTPEIVRTITWHDTEPGVQQVVGLIDKRAVMRSQHLDGFSSCAFDGAGLVVVEHEGERALAEEVPVDFQLGQCVGELLHSS